MDQFYCNPPRYDDVLKKLSQLHRQNRKLKIFSIGKSVLGRKICAASIGDLTNATLYIGAIHSQESLTTTVLMKFLEEIITSKEMFGVNIDDVFAKRGLIVVPMVNPDGVELALGGLKQAGPYAQKVKQIMKDNPDKIWQANIRGVDLNHNFDAGFETLQEMEKSAGILGPAPTQYGGAFPNSEPESSALVKLTKKFDVQKVFAFHSQGEEIYYSYGENTPPSSERMAQALGASSGYTVLSPSGLASHGGFKDWFIDKMHRPGFTIEIGKGKNPLPISDFESVYKKINEMLLIGFLL